jgi:hypothetical protein
MIVDSRGEVVFGKTAALSEEPIPEILDAVATGKPARVSDFAGTRYVKRTARISRMSRKVIESNPCLALGEGGTLFVTCVSTDRKGSGVCLRTVKSGTASGGDKEILPRRSACLTSVDEDAYDAVLAADGRGGMWVFYTGLAKSGCYDIFARPIGPGGGLAEAVNLTESGDDAMYPDAVAGGAGKLWVTYYRWCLMGDTSRDKEIFARCFEEGKWQPEVRLSPEDVPNYEDHTDPSIATDPSGGVTVAWSWDMHKLDHKRYGPIQKKYGAHSPTIFGRRVTGAAGAGEMLFLGHTELDGQPELFRASDGRLWCAWPALVHRSAGNGKTLCTSVTVGDFPERSRQFVLEEGARNLCTPRFFEKGADLHAVWASQDRSRKWTLKRSAFVEGAWTSPVVVEKKGNPRQPAVVVDNDGRVWIACVKDDGPDRKVVLRILDIH